MGVLVDLANDIQQNGLINPVAVNKVGDSFILIAGERRLSAYLEYPETCGDTIPCHVYRDLTIMQTAMVEYAENFHRKQLTWQEDCLAVLDLHENAADIDENWSLNDTAKILGCSFVHVHRKLRVARALRSDDERIQEANNLTAAYNILDRSDQRALDADLADFDDLLDLGGNGQSGEAEELAGLDGIDSITESDLGSGDFSVSVQGDSERSGTRTERIVQGSTASEVRSDREFAAFISGPPPAGGSSPRSLEGRRERLARDATREIIPTDFRVFANNYAGPKFNLIHIDPPYGIAHHKSEQGGASAHGSYADNEDDYWNFLDSLFTNYLRLGAPSAHVLIWHSMKFYSKTRAFIHLKMQELGLEYLRVDHPLIWLKSDSRGIVSDHRRRPQNIYETCSYFSIGDRFIVKPVPNAIAHPTGKRNAKHLSEKPYEVVKHFLRMFVDESTIMADFCCGSGNAIAAAEELGAKLVFGMDLDERHVETARTTLKRTRTLMLQEAQRKENGEDAGDQ